ncbi:unnamed protein product, partial [Mesorhabditis spiculigera]
MLGVSDTVLASATLPVRSAALIEVGDALLLFLTIVYAEMKDGKVKRFVLGAAGLVGLVEPFFHSFLGHLVTLTEGPADEVEYDIVVQDAAHMSAYQRLDDPYADEAKQ